MISDLVSKLKDRHYADLTAKGRLVCPDCGAQATEPPDAGASTMKCPRCRTTTLLEEWSRAGRDGLMVGDADSLPPDTGIVRSQSGGTTTWQIPASGKGCFFLFFAGFWLFVTASLSLPMISGLITDPAKRQGDIPAWAIIPFLGLFWVIGLIVLYVGLRARYARHLLTVDGSSVTLRRELFGRVNEKSIALDEVVRVAQKEFYQQNYEPVFGIEIEGRRSKLRFGSTLENEEKAWLVADLRRAVAGPDDVLPPMAQAPPIGESPSNKQQSFSFVLEIPWRAMLIPSLITIAGGMGFISIAIWVIDAGSPWVKGFEGTGIIRIIWLLISSAVTICAAFMALSALRNRGTQIQLDGDAANVSVRTMKHGRTIQEKWYPRNEITAVRAVTRGQFGTTEMKRVLLLVGSRKVEVGKWVSAVHADDFVRRVKAALGLA